MEEARSFFDGHVTPTNVTLSNFHMYCMSLFKTLVEVAKKLEHIQGSSIRWKFRLEEDALVEVKW